MAHTQATVVKLEFDKVRKLKCKHRHVRDAVLLSKRSVTDLINDPFGGYPYLLMALLQPSKAETEVISLDKASDFIDQFIEKHGSIDGLTRGLVQALSAYLRIEATPVDPDDEEEKSQEAGASPNGPSPGDASGTGDDGD